MLDTRQTKKKSADRNKKYYELNKESIIIRNFLYVEKNKDLVLERRRNYQKNNFIRIKENGSRRRARERNAKTFYITDKDLRRLKNSPCYLCGEKASHIDHIIPLSRGGTHGIGNLAAMCAYENMSKGNLFLVDFKHRRLPRMMKLRNLALV